MKPLLNRRMKIRTCKHKEWITFSKKRTDVIFYDSLTAFILTNYNAPAIDPCVIAQCPPFLRILLLVYVKYMSASYYCQCFALSGLNSLPRVYKNVLKSHHIDFTTSLGQEYITYCLNDAELAHNIIESRQLNQDMARQYFTSFISHDTTIGLSILRRFNIDKATLLCGLAKALEYKVDLVIDAILDHANLNLLHPSCGQEKQQVFMAAATHYHMYIPRLLELQFHKASHCGNAWLSELSRKLPRNYFIMVCGECNIDTITIQRYASMFYDLTD